MLRTWGTAHILTEQFLWDEVWNAFSLGLPTPCPWPVPPCTLLPPQSGGWCFTAHSPGLVSEHGVYTWLLCLVPASLLMLGRKLMIYTKVLSEISRLVSNISHYLAHFSISCLSQATTLGVIFTMWDGTFLNEGILNPGPFLPFSWPILSLILLCLHLYYLL